MSSDRDTTRIVRSWLEEGVTALPDRVLDTVLDQLPTTRQRRPWWPARRSTHMTRTTQFLIAAAAVLVVVVVGYNLLPARPSSLGGEPTPGPTASPTPIPSPTPIAPLPSGSMAAGTYLIGDPWSLVPYSLTVPAGWTGGDGAHRGDAASTGAFLTTWIITDIYSDACHWQGKLVPVADAAALVAAFEAQLGPTHSAAIATTLGGLPATKITFTLSSSYSTAGCDGGSAADHVLRMWPDPGPNENGGYLISPGQTTTVFVIGAKGKVMVLLTVRNKASSAADVTALQEILGSVEFHPAP